MGVEGLDLGFYFFQILKDRKIDIFLGFEFNPALDLAQVVAHLSGADIVEPMGDLLPIKPLARLERKIFFEQIGQ